MACRAYTELSKAAFILYPLASLQLHLEYAMKANSLNLRADVNHLESVQRLATRPVRGLCHVPYEERLR